MFFLMEATLQMARLSRSQSYQIIVGPGIVTHGLQKTQMITTVTDIQVADRISGHYHYKGRTARIVIIDYQVGGHIWHEHRKTNLFGYGRTRKPMMMKR